MRYIAVLTILFCTSLIQLEPLFAQGSCSSLFRHKNTSTHIYNHQDKIATPESLETVQKMMVKLVSIKKLINNPNDYRSKIYSKASFILDQAQNLGKEILKNKAKDQDQVFRFFLLSITLVDLPKEFINEMGRAIDGFASVDTYSRKELDLRLKEFNRKVEDRFIDLVVTNEYKNNQTYLGNLKSGFPYIRIQPNGEIPDMSLLFQHKFIFKDDVLTLFDLIKDRERGVSYLGISRKDHAPYDGQLGNAVSFLKHDLIHAFTQKYFDFVLFNEFKATNTQEMNLLKQRTNELLQRRISEYQAIKDKDLRDAIELWFFVTLHEQAKTYPIGIEMDFKIKGGIDYYKKSIMPTIREGRFGEEYKHFLEKPDVINAAFEWLQKAVKEDSEKLRSFYPKN